ncbi:MAG: beta-lactamase family protein [Flavobacteriales bacterium]|nr:beta-lactamase family protein [Flavobacteriales bacterium]
MKKKKVSKAEWALRVVLLVGTIISMFYVPWPVVKGWLTPIPDTVQEQVEQGLNYGFDGVVVYIDQGGRTPEYYAAGWHDRDRKIPADPNGLFKIASIDKLYTASAITRLVANGQLLLDGTVAEYFPEFAGRFENSDRITLRMLVKHRSGIPNYTDTPSFWSDPPTSQMEVLESAFDLPAEFEPDAKWMYCNTNYLLLSMLIEKVTGKSKFEYIKKVILDPLGLVNTFASIHTIDMNRLMSGYYVGVIEDIKSSDYGCMIATAEDVGAFVRTLNTGTLLSEKEQELYSELYAYDHTGLVPGYMSRAKYYEDLDAVVIQFVNTTNFDGYEWNLGSLLNRRIVKILRNR